jgi:hypothetical protein
VQVLLWLLLPSIAAGVVGVATGLIIGLRATAGDDPRDKAVRLAVGISTAMNCAAIAAVATAALVILLMIVAAVRRSRRRRLL